MRTTSVAFLRRTRLGGWLRSAQRLAIACVFLAVPVASFAQWPQDWSAIANRHGLDPAVLYSAALMASGRSLDNHLAPWPWTLRVDGRIQHYPSQSEAQSALQRLLDEGTNLVGQRLDIRVGLMGIALEHLMPPQSASAALDPKTNLDRGGALLAAALNDATPATALAHLVGDIEAAERLLAATKTRATPPSGPQSVRRIAGTRAYAACTPQAKRPVAELVEAAARRHGVDPAFALAVATRESALRQGAVSPKGARGVMQLMPGTAARYGADAADLAENIDAGTRYLRDLAELFGSDPRLVAAGYNAGEGAVLRHARQIPPFRETQAYVPAVLAARQEYAQCAAP
ncbi:MAG TPA: lytic transglycosylase domain-containing protein [Lamprocystis sp. (in: g-proteobacteria)]|nr:lytic transglycosylase domain-containing protein [Lamprocystis sp. (in: g-proteobacteria)]